MKTAIKWWDKLQKDKVQFSYSESKLKKNVEVLKIWNIKTCKSKLPEKISSTPIEFLCYVKKGFHEKKKNEGNFWLKSDSRGTAGHFFPWTEADLKVIFDLFWRPHAYPLSIVYFQFHNNLIFFSLDRPQEHFT